MPLLAVVARDRRSVEAWELDLTVLLGIDAPEPWASRKPAADPVETGSRYDAVLCFDACDRVAVELIARELAERNVRAWLGDIETASEDVLSQIHAAALFVGRLGSGPWQVSGVRRVLERLAGRGVRMVPVLLPDCRLEPTVPGFAAPARWIDFREQRRNPVERLILALRSGIG